MAEKNNDKSTDEVSTTFYESSAKMELGNNSMAPENPTVANLKATPKKSSHYRSRSDGCTLQLNIPKLVKISDEISYSASTLESPDLNLTKDTTYPCRRYRKMSAPLTGTEFDSIDYDSDIFKLNQTEDVSIPSVTGGFGSRFPRPKPGESLESFLSSADLYKNCGALDRENAHFYISEALMAAFEQMRFEMVCRAAGLMTSSEEDSDEEIKKLQEQIKKKKQEKLAKYTGVTPKTPTQIQSKDNHPSTTDYSVYESPMSSAYTESSDPCSDPVAARRDIRPKTNELLKRQKKRVFGESSNRSRKDGRIVFPDSFSSGSVNAGSNSESKYDEDVDSPTEGGSGSSCCTLSNVALPQNDDSSSTPLKTSKDNSSSDNLTQTLDNSASNDLEGRRRPSISFENNRSAEGIGLKLLQDIAPPTRHLPAASELQWLVSERDAPQKLLPLPADQNLLLRGTAEWAPPREQLILTLQKERKKAAVLISQNYRCTACGQQVSAALSKHYRLCHYFAKYFCTTCHMNQTHTIPAKVLHQWDTKPYPVSCFAHQLLQKLYHEPLFYPTAINANLYSYSKRLNQFRLYRLQLFHCLPYITTCMRAAREQEKVKTLCPSHWYSDKEVVTLQELVLIKLGNSVSCTRPIMELIQSLTEGCIEHISKCQVCHGRGFICEVCNKDPVIFPFELSTVRVCDSCNSCTHFRCPLNRCQRCDLRQKKKLNQ